MRSMVQLADRSKILPSFLWLAFESGRGLTRPNANVSHTAAEIDQRERTTGRYTSRSRPGNPLSGAPKLQNLILDEVRMAHCIRRLSIRGIPMESKSRRFRWHPQVGPTVPLMGRHMR